MYSTSEPAPSSRKNVATSQVDEAETSPTASLDFDPVYSQVEQRKIIRRIDRRLILTCGVMYWASLIDRTNLSVAAVTGMLTELKMTGYRYNIIALAFFVTYVLSQPLATVLCRKIGPRLFLASITFAWGVLTIGFAFSKTWEVLIPFRLILGLLEAGFFPGCVYLISTWYSRYDLQKRYAVFYFIGCFTSAFSGILGLGFVEMGGVAHLSGWRWIFIWCGIITCVVAIGSYGFLVEFPDTCAKKASKMFLSEEECVFILRRISKDRDDAKLEPWSFKRWISSGADPKIWAFALIFMCLTTVTYAIAFFLPIILRQSMGFSVRASLCLGAPPFAFAGIFMIGSAWLADKYHIRGPILAFNAVVCLIGLPIMGFAARDSVRYFGVFLVCAGSYANVPTCMAYQANNIRGQWKRAFCSATLIGFGGIGGIAGSLVFRAKDSPSYRPGFYAAIAANVLVIIIVSINSVCFSIQNKKADLEGKILEGSPGFRYTI